MADGRGRPGRIDQLPEVKSMVDRLLRRGVTQADILARLAPLTERLGEAPISRSGLNRYSARMEAVGRDIRETEAIAAVWVPQFGEQPGQVGQLVIEMLKSVIFKIMLRVKEGIDGEETEIGAEDVGALALAVQRLERASASGDERMRRLRAELADKAAKQAGVEARKAGFKLPPEALRAIREQVYGIYDE